MIDKKLINIAKNIMDKPFIDLPSFNIKREEELEKSYLNEIERMNENETTVQTPEKKLGII